MISLKYSKYLNHKLKVILILDIHICNIIIFLNFLTVPF